MNPCLLYGCGAYAISMPAAFSSNRLSLVDRGVLYAIAQVRGGSEKGWRRYREGKLAKKTNTFAVTNSDREVAIIGGGAAGIAAGRRLAEARIDCLIMEARPRLGGRAWTTGDGAALALDLGCGWLHSADRNPWHAIAVAQGRAIDKTPPPWRRPSTPTGFPLAEQAAFFDALAHFYHRLESLSEHAPDVAAATFLAPHGRWNGLISAVGSYVSGAELERVSARDFQRYDDSGVNWRVVDGYGAVIAAHGERLPVLLGSPAQRIDHRGHRLRVDMADGTVTAEAVIITLPSALLADETLSIIPPLPEKIAAAAGLPLGLADKLFFSLSDAAEFDKESRLFGRTDRSGTGVYHFRPFGRPQVEAYFGGRLAAELEAAGEAAFVDFAVAELAGLLGSDFARRVKPLGLHRWGSDPFARGSYSYALPGQAACRGALAAAVDNRLFFAGEACSQHDYSTAHGAYLTGVVAAEQVIAVRRAKRSR
jgi:monoamine oxidase